LNREECIADSKMHENTGEVIWLLYLWINMWGKEVKAYGNTYLSDSFSFNESLMYITYQVQVGDTW
jgi:hypothetical protein